MQWLAIKYFDDEFYFYQTREERETQINALIGSGKRIETIVIRVFDSEEEVRKYCKDINHVSGIIDNIDP